MSRVLIAESPIHGRGVFATAAFDPGAIVLKVDDSRVMTADNPLDPGRGEFEHHCDTVAGGRVVLMQLPERLINHRCDPNTYYRTIAGERFIVALRAIRPGDEITSDYCINGDGDTAWDCSCGSPACRRRHLSGFFHLPVAVQARYLALLDDWFVAEYPIEVADLKRQIEVGGGDPAATPEDNGTAIALTVNTPIDGDEAEALFRAAWGAAAPDAPPALDRCLAHIAAHDAAGRLVGFVKLAWDGGAHAFLLDTTVHPEHQRRGIGRRLVARATEVARAAGVEWLHVDYEPDHAAFYARCGFRPTPAGLIRLGDSLPGGLA